MLNTSLIHVQVNESLDDSGISSIGSSSILSGNENGVTSPVGHSLQSPTTERLDLSDDDVPATEKKAPSSKNRPKKGTPTGDKAFGRDSRAGNKSSKSNRSSDCVKHGQGLRFFCTNCKVQVCVKCVVRDHNKCNLEPLHGYTMKLWESILEEERCDFRAVKSNIVHMQRSFELKARYIRDEIDKLTNHVMYEIEEERRNLLRKLDHIKRAKASSWKRQLDLCDQSLRMLSNCNQYPGNSFKEINKVRKNIFSGVKSELDFIEDENINFVTDMVPHLSLGKICGSASPKNCLVKLPKKSFSRTLNYCTLVIRDLFNDEITNVDYTVTATLEDADHNLAYLEIENLQNGKFKIVYYPEVMGKHLIHIHLNSLPIENSPFEVDAASPKDLLSPIIIGEEDSDSDSAILRPWGIATDLQGRIFVVDRGHNCVKVFSEDGPFLYCFGREGSNPGEFLKPAGIAIDRSLQRVAVADKDNHRIQILSTEGGYLFHFGEQGTEDGQLSYPWDVAVSPKSEIAVSDSKNRRVQLFSKNGEFLRKFSFKIDYVKELELPRGLAFNADCSLLVTDFNKHRIIQLDDDFKSAKRLGSEGSDLGLFFRPQSIDVDQTGRFVVSDCKNHRIQVFSSEGDLCAVIGSQGSKPGELDTPQGICLLRNGRIAVAELNNNRVQIFKVPNWSKK